MLTEARTSDGVGDGQKLRVQGAGVKDITIDEDTEAEAKAKEQEVDVTLLHLSLQWVIAMVAILLF